MNFGVQKRKGLKGFLCFHTKSLKWPLMDSAIRGRLDKVHLGLSTRYLHYFKERKFETE